MNCPNCNTPIAPNELACPICNTPVSQYGAPQGFQQVPPQGFQQVPPQGFQQVPPQGFVPPGYTQKELSVFQSYGWFLGGLGIHDFYAGYRKKGLRHAFLSRLSLLFFAFFFLFTDLEHIEEQPFMCFVLCACFIIFIINNIWAIVETVSVKNDSNNVPMR